ncbi:MAG TPA: Hsp20/alpha crystallin family protein [Candidatus Synoicihabitans sp.]|nr:Hsp20/alpha crystallin family protein [Candidatus Synoicihabitans sp.]
MSLFNSLIPAFNRTPAATRNGQEGDLGPTIRPYYNVKETDEAFGLTVHLPGVGKDGLEITAEDNSLRIVGRRTWQRPEGWTSLFRESSDAAYELVLSHEHAIDVDKIHAELRDGVLRLSLPKAEAIKPRKISVA